MANIWIIVAFGIWILLLSFPVANGLHDMNLTVSKIRNICRRGFPGFQSADVIGRSIGANAKLPLNPNGTVFKVKPGELTRWYVVNPGPNDGIAFHFISGQIDVHDGFIKNRYGTQRLDDETWWILQVQHP